MIVRRRASAAGAALLLLAAACVRTDPPPELPPLPGPDGGYVDCTSACAGLRERGCSAGDVAEDGASCEEVCADTEAFREGLFLRAAAEPCAP